MYKNKQGHNKLKIYNKAHSLGINIHKMSFKLPKHEMYEEGSQIRRSSKSVSSNIVEGYALRKYKNEYLHFLYHAFASCEETIEHLKNLKETESLKDNKTYNELSDSYSELSSMLFSFIASVENFHETPYFLKKSNDKNNEKR